MVDICVKLNSNLDVFLNECLDARKLKFIKNINNFNKTIQNNYMNLSYHNKSQSLMSKI